jgi:hypothetical protein
MKRKQNGGSNNEEEQTTPQATLRLDKGSNDVNTTLLEIGFMLYI